MVRSGLTFARDHVVLLLGPPMFVVASGTFFALGTGQSVAAVLAASFSLLFAVMFWPFLVGIPVAVEI